MLVGAILQRKGATSTRRKVRALRARTWKNCRALICSEQFFRELARDCTVTQRRVIFLGNFRAIHNSEGLGKGTPENYLVHRSRCKFFSAGKHEEGGRIVKLCGILLLTYFSIYAKE